jgi:prepilin-type N-terminal cleavage/methylation domain-containing protein
MPIRRDPGPVWCMRSGFSLIELVLVLALLTLLLGIALPPLTGALDRIEVASAASQIAAAHSRARMMAISASRVLVLSVDSATLSIHLRGSTSHLWSDTGPARSGVSLPGPTRSFTFSPEGFSLGLSNASLHLSRGSARRTVVVSRLGRVRITP